MDEPKCRGFGWVDFRAKQPTLRCIGLPFVPTEIKATAPYRDAGITSSGRDATHAAAPPGDVVTVDSSRTPSAPSDQWQDGQRDARTGSRLLCLGTLYDAPGDQLMRCDGYQWFSAKDPEKSDKEGLRKEARHELLERFGERCQAVFHRAFTEVPSMLAHSPVEVGQKLTKVSESILRRSGRISYRCGEMLMPGYRPPPLPEDPENPENPEET